MAIDIPLADIHTLKEIIQTLTQQINRLRTLMEDPENEVVARRHTFRPDTLNDEEAISHPWLESNPPSDDPVADCIDAIRDIWYDDDRIDPRRTRPYPAVVIANEGVIEQVKAVNATKDHLKKTVTGIKSRYRNLTDVDLSSRIDIDRDGLALANAAIKQTLHQAGMARICIKQAYRHIPVYNETLYKAKYYYAPKRPSRKRRVSEQITLFRTKQSRGDNSPELASAIEALHQLPGDLVISERQAPTFIITANCKVGTDDEALRWAQSTAVMPVFFAGAAGELDNIVDCSGLNTPIEERNTTPTRVTTWQPDPFIAHYRLHLPADFVI